MKQSSVGILSQNEYRALWKKRGQAVMPNTTHSVSDVGTCDGGVGS